MIDAHAARPRAAGWLLALVAFGALRGIALFLPESRFVAAFHDDAFYYFGVARNVAAGNGFTFDGVHATNGFHPLWLGALVPLFGIVRDDVSVLRAIVVLQIALVTLAAAAVLRALVPRLGPGAATSALALVALPGSAHILAGGLESSLVLLCVVATWIRFDRVEGADDSRVGEWVAIGGLAAAAFLARFEALVLVPVCLVFARRRLREDPRRLVALLAAPAAAVLGCAAWNRVGFGTWLPISGLVKSERAAQVAPWARVSKAFEVPWFGADLLDKVLARSGIDRGAVLHGILQVALLGALLLAAWRFRGALRSAVRDSHAGFLLVAAAAWLALDRTAGLHVETWNRVPIHLGTAVLLGALVSVRPRLAVTSSILLLLLATGRMAWDAHALGSAGTTYATYRHRAALWLREKTPEDARVGSWNAGLLGYFSHRAVVNLDGLVNDRRYFEEVIVGRDLDGYLRRERIVRLADQSCGLDPSLRPYLSRTASERLEGDFLPEAVFADEEVPDRCPGYVIWRRQPD